MIIIPVVNLVKIVKGVIHMKRFVALLLVVVIMATMLCACGSFTCDLCGEKKSGKKHTENFLGEKITYCNDCKEELEEFGNMFG